MIGKERRHDTQLSSSTFVGSMIDPQPGHRRNFVSCSTTISFYRITLGAEVPLPDVLPTLPKPFRTTGRNVRLQRS
jgi:hypothetical protein